jgi:hypothetical protein
VLHSRTSHGIPSPLGNINTKANDQRCSRAYPEQEREALPIVLRLVDDRLDDTRPDRGRRAVGKTEQAKELRVYRSTPGGRRPQQTTYHVVKPQWTQLSDHRLRKGMVRCLEQTVVGPGFDQKNLFEVLQSVLTKTPRHYKSLGRFSHVFRQMDMWTQCTLTC